MPPEQQNNIQSELEPIAPDVKPDIIIKLLIILSIISIVAVVAGIIYIQSLKVEGDAPSTENIEKTESIDVTALSSNSGYTKDSTYVYWYTSPVTDADPTTFVSLNEYYGKDAEQVFYRGVSVHGVDTPSFTALQGEYGKDINAIFGPTCWPGGEAGGPSGCVSALENIDPETFVAFENGYVKDKDAVYYDVFGWTKIPDADPMSFSALSPNYGVDNLHIFNKGKAIDARDVDLKTFSLIDEDYFKDENSIYYLINVTLAAIPTADIETFEVLGKGYAKDVHQVYFLGKEMTDADPSSFKVITYINRGESVASKFAKDNYMLYRGDTIVDNIDPETFEVLDHIFAVDKNGVYFYGGFGSRMQLIAQADPKTFISLGSGYGKDKNYVYYYNKVILDADVDTFSPDDYSYGERVSK